LLPADNIVRQSDPAALKAVVIVPTYNEIDNLEPLVARLLELDGLGVIVVDDNSPDGTGELADRLAVANPRVHVIHRPGKLGLGTAYSAGFVQAIAMGVPLIVTMDADFSHDPRYLPDLLAAASDHDLVIGSRYVPGGSARDCLAWRVALSRGANGFARFMLRLKAHDCTAGFRCYRREVLERIDPGTVRSEGYSYLIEMLFRVQRAGFRVGEVPIEFVNRRRGASKISRHEILRALGTVWRLWWQQVAGAATQPERSQGEALGPDPSIQRGSGRRAGDPARRRAAG